MSDIVIRARDLRKVYRLYPKPHYRFLDMFGLLPDRAGAYAEHAAIDGVSLDIRRGEKVAIIGRNGAGKSTLLKLVTGVIAPTAGELRVAGRAHALLQIGTGFHPDFTGRENVYAYLSHVGITGREADTRCAEIIEFSEIEEYVDQPVKTYSTGMGVRLMFAAATAIEPELLVLDEVLGVGDAYFAQKSYERMRELTAGAGTTLLLVTHDVYSAVKLCDRLIWIDRGRVLMDGGGPSVIRAYEDSIRQQEEARLRLRKQHRLHEDTTRDRAVVPVMFELHSVGNVPASTPVYLGRIELSVDGVRQGLPLDMAAFNESRSAHLQREGTAWGEPVEHEGRWARALLNYGSPFHKVAGVIPMPAGALSRVRAEVDYCAGAPFRATVRLFAGGEVLDLGVIEGEADGWRTWRSGHEAPRAAAAAEVNPTGVHGTGVIGITDIDTYDGSGRQTHLFTHGEPFEVRVGYRINQPDYSGRPQVLIALHRDGVQDICRLIARDLEFDAAAGCHGVVHLRIPKLQIGTGTYTVTVMIAREGYYDEEQTLYFSLNPGVFACHTRALEFVVMGGGAVASGTVIVGGGDWRLT